MESQAPGMMRIMISGSLALRRILRHGTDGEDACPGGGDRYRDGVVEPGTAASGPGRVVKPRLGQLGPRAGVLGKPGERLGAETMMGDVSGGAERSLGGFGPARPVALSAVDRAAFFGGDDHQERL